VRVRGPLGRVALALLIRLKTIRPDDDRLDDPATLAEPAADAKQAVADRRAGVNDATIGHETILDHRAADARRRQKAHAREDRAIRMVELESGRVARQVEG